MMRIFLILMISFSAFSAIAQTGSFNASKPNLETNDLYVFNSYENGRDAFVTIIVNYAQAPTDEFAEVFFDPNANYEIHIDSDGNGVENQTYRFRFAQELKDDVTTINVSGEEISLPFLSFANIQTDSTNVFKERSFTVELIRKKPSYIASASGPNKKNKGKSLRLANVTEKISEFAIPENLIDSSSFSDYAAYSQNGFVYDLDLRFKKCTETARVFTGQRAASFQGNLDGLGNNLDFNFLSANGQTSSTADKSVLSIALELPKSCLDLPNDNSTIAVWSTINYPARSITRSIAIFGRPNLNSIQDFVQIDRMGHPFVRELLIGYNDKVSFTQRRAKNDDERIEDYFEYPALAELIDNGTSFTAPNLFPREDLVEFYLFGIEGLNQISENKKAKKLREFEAIRLDTASAALSAASQNTLGVIGGDDSGYPNGRRPGDDVVDIFLRTLMGFFVEEVNAADKNTAFSDGVSLSASDFQDSFPYLNSPN